MRPSVTVLLVLCCAAPAAAQSDTTRRCSQRIAQSLGLSWRFQVPMTTDPQATARTWLKHPVAIRNFAAFINSRFNATPGANLSQEVLFYAVKFILTNDRPWAELYTGRFTVDETNGQVRDNPSAPPLGYLGANGWLKRYQGNEVNGVMLSAAYRTLQNTIGLKLLPSPKNGEGDATASGRERGECRGCHFDSPYALDKVARLLPKRVGIGVPAVLQPQAGAPQVIFNGVTVADHAQLVDVLVRSDAFFFWSCRLAFEFVWGRPESACEAPTFDRCVDTLKRTGKMNDALASLYEDPAYCSGVGE